MILIKSIFEIKHTKSKIPTGRTPTSWLFSSVLKELILGLPQIKKQLKLAIRAGLEPGTPSDCESNDLALGHTATLTPHKGNQNHSKLMQIIKIFSPTHCDPHERLVTVEYYHHYL